MNLARILSVSLTMLPAILMTVAARAADAPPERVCYVLDKIDTPADHDGDPDGFKASNQVRVNADGSITVTRIGKGMRNEGCVFQIWPREGRATYMQGSGRNNDTGAVTWTPWPNGMCTREAGIALSIRASAQGNATFGASYQTQAEQFAVMGVEPATNSPLRGVYANKGNASGAITVQLTGTYHGQFVASVALADDGYSVPIHYHYRPLKPGEMIPPKTDPPGSCTKTFGKSWPSTDWGVVAFTLDGDKAAGTYSNRSGKFGAGTIVGTVAGNVLAGTWGDANGKGSLKIVLSDNGCNFTGRFTVDGSSPPTDDPLGGSAHPKGTPESSTSDGKRSSGGGAIDLTGFWKSDTGALYYLRQMGDKLYWSMDAMPSARNIFMGAIAGDTLTGTWVDLPGGASETGTGTLTIKIESNDRLTKISDSSPYGAGAWFRIGKPGATGTGPGTDTAGTVTAGVGAEPWNTPAGRARIDAWVTEAMAKLNAYDGGPSFNARKPWGIDAKYGVLTGSRLTSSISPDEFARYKYNRYWWIWDHYVKNADGLWDGPEWNKAGVPDLHDYVAKHP